jgi:hypothetical protein
MVVCNCTLAGTKACENCRNNIEFDMGINSTLTMTGECDFSQNLLEEIIGRSICPQTQKEKTKNG